MRPAFMSCTSSPASGTNDDDPDVGKPRDVELVLTDADRFDEDDVEPRGVEHVSRPGRRAREASELSPRRQTADEDAGIGRVRLHPHTVTEERAAAERARRIDREHTDRPPRAAKFRDQPIDECALARRRAGR